MREGLIVRQARPRSLSFSRVLGPAITVNFVRVHQGNLQVGSDAGGGGARQLQLKLVSALETEVQLVDSAASPG